MYYKMSNNEDIHLFFGHQNRTKGYIIKVFNELIKYSTAPEVELLGEKIRFSNGSILELKMVRLSDNEIQLDLSLVYTGDYSGNKKSEKYWTATDYNQDNGNFISVPFGIKSITITPEQLEKEFKIDPEICCVEGRQIICYFVRHGYSTHNVESNERFLSLDKSLFNTNTSLTNPMTGGEGGEGGEEGEEEREVVEGDATYVPEKIGTEQSLNSGIKFAQILGDRQLTSICVSDLIRTHQTAQYFLTGLTKFKPNALSNIPFIYVLPCFHELSGKDGEGQIMNNISRTFTLGQTQGLVARENNTNCRNDADFNKTRYSGKQRNNCGSIQVGDKTILLDWDFYKTSYNGKYRDQFETEFSTRQNPCKDNNFLGMFLDYFYKEPVRGGKTRKHKKLNKKHKTHKKHKKISKKNKFIHRKTRKHKY